LFGLQFGQIRAETVLYLVHGSKQMKKNRLAAGALALAVSITACGCGDQIYEMTEEEEAAVVHYAAHAVSKFNKKQSEGIEDVAVLKALRELKEKEAEERRRQQEEEEKQQEEQQKPADSGQANPSSGEQPAQPEVNYVPLKQALKLGSGMDAVYRKYELTSAYQASQSYMVRADSGNDLLILHVNLKNSGNKTAECNILSKMPSFRLTVNGELSVSADTTILLNDLGTYQGRIRAGEKERTVLVFQVKKGAVKSIGSMELEVTINGKASLVQLADK